MHPKSVKFFVVVVLSLLFVFNTVAPAFAQSPNFYYQGEPVAFEFADCGDFIITAEGYETLATTVFFDSSGHWVRTQVQYAYAGTMTNSVTGKSVTDSPDHQTYVFSPDVPLTVHGLILSINIPGVGIVGLDAGTISMDFSSPDHKILFQSAKHLMTDSGEPDYTPICNAMR